MGSGRRGGAIAAAVFLLALPVAAASHDWVNTTYYKAINSSVSKSTLAPGEAFTHTVTYTQNFNGYTTLSGYWCCWSGQVWKAGPFHASSGVAKSVTVTMTAPTTPGNHDVWGFVVSALSAYPTPTYRNGETHVDIKVVGNPTKPCLSETHTGGGWSTHASPMWSWGCSTASFGSITNWEVDPSWAASFKTGSGSVTTYHPTLGTGTHTVRVRAQNNVGVWSAWSDPVAAKVDVTPPTKPTLVETHLGGAPWSNHPHPHFSWSATDPGSGVSSYSGELDGATVSLGSATTYHPTLADGEHTFRVTAKDAVGHASPASSLLTVRIDTGPPTTTLDVGAPAHVDAATTWVTSATPLAVDAADAGCGVVGVEARVDGGPFGPYAGPFTLEGEGPHAVGHRASDCAGNVGAEATTALTVDDAAPAVAILRPAAGVLYVADVWETASPTGGTVVVGDLTVDAAASDSGVGLDRVELLADGVLLGEATEAPFSISWSAGDLALGAHTLTLRAVDRLGNAAETSLEVTTVPTTAAGLAATAEAASGGELPDLGEVPDAGDLLPDPDDLPDPGEDLPDPGPFPPAVEPVVNLALDPNGKTVTFTVGVRVNGEFTGASGKVPPAEG